MKIGVLPGANAYSLLFGEKEHVKLGFFKMDVPHVLHVDTYCDVMHEALHFLFNDVQQNEKTQINRHYENWYYRFLCVFQRYPISSPC